MQLHSDVALCWCIVLVSAVKLEAVSKLYLDRQHDGFVFIDFLLCVGGVRAACLYPFNDPSLWQPSILFLPSLRADGLLFCPKYRCLLCLCQHPLTPVSFLMFKPVTLAANIIIKVTHLTCATVYPAGTAAIVPACLPYALFTHILKECLSPHGNAYCWELNKWSRTKTTFLRHRETNAVLYFIYLCRQGDTFNTEEALMHSQSHRSLLSTCCCH